MYGTFHVLHFHHPGLILELNIATSQNIATLYTYTLQDTNTQNTYPNIEQISQVIPFNTSLVNKAEKNHHTRELINAQNTQHKYNKDLSHLR